MTLLVVVELSDKRFAWSKCRIRFLLHPVGSSVNSNFFDEIQFSFLTTVDKVTKILTGTDLI